MTDPEITLQEAAAITGYAHSTLRQAARQGDLEVRREGEGIRAIYYTTEAAAREWARSRRRRPARAADDV